MVRNIENEIRDSLYKNSKNICLPFTNNSNGEAEDELEWFLKEKMKKCPSLRVIYLFIICDLGQNTCRTIGNIKSHVVEY